MPNRGQIALSIFWYAKKRMAVLAIFTFEERKKKENVECRM